MKIAKTTLRLTLKKKWFDMIASGEKKEEYREIKPYWDARLTENITFLPENIITRSCRHYDYAEFINGYGKYRPRMVFEVDYITTGNGNPEWGAKEGERYYIIRLGGRII